MMARHVEAPDRRQVPAALEGIQTAGATPVRSGQLGRWQGGVSVSPVCPAQPERHALHAYYTADPEHPAGGQVLVYTSAEPEAYRGEIRVVSTTDPEAERVLAGGVSVEDSHRAACQQWVSGGRRVAFHDVRGEEWVVVCVDVETGTERLLARGRQLGWGHPGADVVPLYGPHWDPEAFRDLELLDVSTGERRTVLTADAVRQAYPDLIREAFGDRPVSIFFPTLSPDGDRVFFKMATPLGGPYRSPTASHRALLLCYDLAAGRFRLADRRWGHPAWHPDSRTILDVPGVLIDTETGQRRTLAGVPRLPGAHPSWDPDGMLYVADVALERLGGAPGEWGIVVVDSRTEEALLLHRFDDSHGAASWRRCHPHPVFSADGQRIYFCASSTPWSQLTVAAAGDRPGARRA
jgi:hypothetical protein